MKGCCERTLMIGGHSQREIIAGFMTGVNGTGCFLTLLNMTLNCDGACGQGTEEPTTELVCDYRARPTANQTYTVCPVLASKSRITPLR